MVGRVCYRSSFRIFSLACSLSGSVSLLTFSIVLPAVLFSLGQVQRGHCLLTDREAASSFGFFAEMGTRLGEVFGGHTMGKVRDSDPRGDALLEEALRTQNEPF